MLRSWQQRPVTFALQALFVRKTPVVPFFGPTTGFVVNYTPDQACGKSRSQKYSPEWGSTNTPLRAKRSGGSPNSRTARPDAGLVGGVPHQPRARLRDAQAEFDLVEIEARKRVELDPADLSAIGSIHQLVGLIATAATVSHAECCPFTGMPSTRG
jgi:hypothetical protein